MPQPPPPPPPLNANTYIANAVRLEGYGLCSVRLRGSDSLRSSLRTCMCVGSETSAKGSEEWPGIRSFSAGLFSISQRLPFQPYCSLYHLRKTACGILLRPAARSGNRTRRSAALLPSFARFLCIILALGFLASRIAFVLSVGCVCIWGMLGGVEEIGRAHV